MTGEQFRTEYHLLDRVSSGAVETYHAQAATGAMIMVHFLRGSAQENAAILTQLHRLEPTRAARVLRTLEVDGETTVVTRFILDFVTFAEWIREGLLPESAHPVGAPAVPPPAPVAVTPPPPAPVPPPPPPVRDTAPRAVDEAVDRPATAQPEPEPGEFTRMFKAVKPLDPEPAAPPSSRHDPAPATQPPPPAGAAPPAASAADGPGEFTLMFRAPGTPAEPPHPAPPAASRPTGPESAAPRPPHAERPPQSSQPPAPAHETITPAARDVSRAPTDWLASLQAVPGDAPGDVERRGAEERAAPESRSPTGTDNAAPAGSAPASVEPPFSGPQRPGPPRADAWPPPAPPPAAPGSTHPAPAAPPPAPAGPGDFTQMFGAAARPSDQAPASVPPTPAAPRPAPQPPAPAPPSYASGFSFGDAGPPKAPFRPQSEPPPEPGGYTRMFGSPKLPDPGSPPAVPPTQGGSGSGQIDAPGTGGSYFDRLAGGAAPAKPPVPPPVLPPPAPVQSGPSEFTRVISAGQLPAVPPAPRPSPLSPPTPAPPRRVSDRTLVFALIGVLVAAVIFVVVVAVS